MRGISGVRGCTDLTAATGTITPELPSPSFAHPDWLPPITPKCATQKIRYEFEHGPSALWRKAAAQTLSVRLVTWDNEWEPRAWRMPRDILWRGGTSLIASCGATTPIIMPMLIHALNHLAAVRRCSIQMKRKIIDSSDGDWKMYYSS